MATAFVIIMSFIIPTLMLSKTEVWYGFVLNFLTVLLFAGLNEIARELEYPFKCMPNDIPVRSRGTIHISDDMHILYMLFILTLFLYLYNHYKLNLHQAQFNEALVTMFSGYHPDSWWEAKGDA